MNNFHDCRKMEEHLKNLDRNPIVKTSSIYGGRRLVKEVGHFACLSAISFPNRQRIPKEMRVLISQQQSTSNLNILCQVQSSSSFSFAEQTELALISINPDIHPPHPTNLPPSGKTIFSAAANLVSIGEQSRQPQHTLNLVGS